MSDEFRDIAIVKFQEKLKEIREAAGWTTEALGNKIGLTKQTISNLENHKCEMTKTQYIAIRSVLDAECRMAADNQSDSMKKLAEKLAELDKNQQMEEGFGGRSQIPGWLSLLISKNKNMKEALSISDLEDLVEELVLAAADPERMADNIRKPHLKKIVKEGGAEMRKQKKDYANSVLAGLATGAAVTITAVGAFGSTTTIGIAGAEIATMTLAGAAAGSVWPVLGTLIGATAGMFAGVTTYFDIKKRQRKNENSLNAVVNKLVAQEEKSVSTLRSELQQNRNVFPLNDRLQYVAVLVLLYDSVMKSLKNTDCNN